MSRLRCPDDRRRGFTLVELLAVVAIVALLAGLLLPALGRATDRARRTQCLGNLRDIGLAWQVYLADHDDRFPDRRDLKLGLPGGWRPWTGWPRSDPRSGWAALTLDRILTPVAIWTCPGRFRRSVVTVAPLAQPLREEAGAPRVEYWHWRFDRAGSEIPLDNFWGKRVGQCLQDLRAADNPFIGRPNGVVDVELVADAYFPSTVPDAPREVAGKGPHGSWVNRAYLDGHAAASRDRRLAP